MTAAKLHLTLAVDKSPLPLVERSSVAKQWVDSRLTIDKDFLIISLDSQLTELTRPNYIAHKHE